MIRTQSTSAPALTQSSTPSFDVTQAIEQHLPLAKKVASMAFSRYGRHFELEDLEGYAMLGLVYAASKYATKPFDMSQALDFTAYAEKRIWRNVEAGRDRLATLCRSHYRLIKQGKMPKPQFVHDAEDFSLAGAIATATPERTDNRLTSEMIEWLQDQNPVWSRILELRLQGMTLVQIAKVVGLTPSAARSLYSRAMNQLRWKYNPAAYRPDNRNARRRLAPRRKKPLDTQG